MFLGNHISITLDVHVSGLCRRMNFCLSFCEIPSLWGYRQNTSCLRFVKGSRFLNMVMTFVLHPLPHYNSIIKPCACLLLSFIEDLTIDLPSHFIRHTTVSYPKSIRIRRPVISLSFLLLSRGSFTTPLSLIPSFPTSPSWVPSARYPLDGAKPSFDLSGHRSRQRLL